MKALRLLILLGWLPLLLLQCKPEKKVDKPDPNDPDSLYVGTPFNLEKPGIRWRNIQIPADNPMTLEGIQLGRMLFWDPIISRDSTLACASCHEPQHAFSDPRQFSVNAFGQLTSRNASSIINAVWMPQLFWDGRVKSLEELCDDALRAELDFTPQLISRLERNEQYVSLFKKAFGRPGTITQQKIEKALSQFMRTMISADSKFDRFINGQLPLTAAEERGRVIFMTEKGDCFHCHTDNSFMTMTNNLFHNNALQEAATINDFADPGLGGVTKRNLDYGRMKSPTLRNIEFSAPYMHDGRFKTLREVVDFYSEGLKTSPTVDPLMKNVFQGGVQLNEQEKEDLIAFLKTLSDPSFNNNPAFSNPFEN